MGTLLGKFGEAVVGLPGGCYLGPRPIDLHVKGFEALGAEVTNEHGAMYLRTENEGCMAIGFLWTWFQSELQSM